MGTPASSATAAFWQQARQLPHMNTFNMNNTPMGHHNHVPHQYTNHHAPQPHDAKMAEKIVSELQVAVKFTIPNNFLRNHVKSLFKRSLIQISSAFFS